MYLKQTLIVFLTITSMYILNGQTKNEKEERINLSKFPINSQIVISKLPKTCKHLKFYIETDGNKLSYEVKFKFNKQRYSLEFSDDGLIEDIEVTSKLKLINKVPKKEIKTYFQNTYTKYKIIKLQKQFVYNSETGASQFINAILNKAIEIVPNFEIIAEVKTKEKREIREFTFNNAGSFLNSRIVNSTSYEHVLY